MMLFIINSKLLLQQDCQAFLNIFTVLSVCRIRGLIHSKITIMKKILYLLLWFTVSVITTNAQKLITVQSLSGVKQYTSLDSAIANASNGDHIFVNGGIFNINNLVINKSVMIFGTGHFHDSTIATGESYLIGNIILSTGASGGLITGFDISGDITVAGTGADSVSNYTISRCRIENLKLSQTGLPPTNARNFSVYENIIRSNIYGARAVGLNISKNFIEGYVAYMQNAIISNNNFLGLGNCSSMLTMLKNVKSSNLDNNIFLFTPPACAGAAFFDTGCANNVMMNNILTMNLNFPSGTNSGFNNYNNQPVNSIFMSASGGAFQYSDNYFLKASSPGVYGGTDSFDVGVYGTLEPFKTASVPFNPHIQQKNVGQTTNPQGLLNIQIRVSAQDH